MKELYFAQRIRKLTDSLYGLSHGYESGDETLCGIDIQGDGVWWIGDIGKDVTKEITCKKCLRAIELDRRHNAKRKG